MRGHDLTHIEYTKFTVLHLEASQLVTTCTPPKYHHALGHGSSTKSQISTTNKFTPRCRRGAAG